LGDGQRVVQQQRDEVFAEHAASRPHQSSKGESGEKRRPKVRSGSEALGRPFQDS
jgi:hypothetical protein